MTDLNDGQARSPHGASAQCGTIVPRGNGPPDFAFGRGHRPAFWRNEANGHHPGVLAERSQRASPRCLGGTKPTGITRCLGGTKPTGAARSIGGTKPTGTNRCIGGTNPPTIYCPWVPALRAQPPDQVRGRARPGHERLRRPRRRPFGPNEANARNVDASTIRTRIHPERKLIGAEISPAASRRTRPFLLSDPASRTGRGRRAARIARPRPAKSRSCG